MKKETFRERFAQYDRIKNRLFCSLVAPRREEGCRTMLSRPWMDLEICCYYDMAEEGMPGASAKILEKCLSVWHVTEETVLEDAWRNTKAREVLFRPLDSVLQELLDAQELFDEPDSEPESSLYLLTNPRRMYGAVYMAVPEILGEIGKKLGMNFYILPSSIHECMILPDKGQEDEDHLNFLVRMINGECLPESDILSDHVYYYDRLLKHVRICG